jgi:hypothetical protein
VAGPAFVQGVEPHSDTGHFVLDEELEDRAAISLSLLGSSKPESA